MATPNPRFELAHLAYAELLTPNMEGTLWFFTEPRSTALSHVIVSGI